MNRGDYDGDIWKAYLLFFAAVAVFTVVVMGIGHLAGWWDWAA